MKEYIVEVIFTRKYYVEAVDQEYAAEEALENGLLDFLDADSMDVGTIDKN